MWLGLELGADRDAFYEKLVLRNKVFRQASMINELIFVREIGSRGVVLVMLIRGVKQ